MKAVATGMVGITMTITMNLGAHMALMIGAINAAGMDCFCLGGWH